MDLKSKYAEFKQLLSLIFDRNNTAHLLFVLRSMRWAGSYLEIFYFPNIGKNRLLRPLGPTTQNKFHESSH